MLCALNLYVSGGTYSLTGLFTLEFFPAICGEEIVKEIFFFILRFDAWPGIRTRALHPISQHTTY